jgi:uncharacterized protein (DUF2252 family)
MTITPVVPEGVQVQVDHLTVEERTQIGKKERARVARSSHSDWAATPERLDPVAILKEQATTRVPELVPIRHGRMAASPFAFYRGAAAVMAADFAGGPRTNLKVQLCGDAHLVNFGGFGSPERSLVFDINDFDETHPGPFEWDLKRLAASLQVAARSREFDPDTCAEIVLEAVRAYRETIRKFAGMSNLDVWYARLDAEEMMQRWGRDLTSSALKNFQKQVEKAETKDRLKAKERLTHVVDGQVRFLSDPPLLVPAEELFEHEDHRQLFESIRDALRAYRHTLPLDRRHLLERYQYVQLARKVVGVGSVGTRCWLALLLGRDQDDPLFIQVKEAEASVLEPYLGHSGFANHGQRVVEGQRLMQATSDILLGWERVQGVDGRTHDYYMRQLWDWKASANIDTMEPGPMKVYGQVCGWTLARGHARSGDAVAIGAYLGSGGVFDEALREFAALYADQNELDHQRLVDAIAKGEVQAESGI